MGQPFHRSLVFWYNAMETVAIIPSRYESKRFAAKPLALICGKPMVQRVYEQTVKADTVGAVFVATDDRRIFETVEGFGGRAVMTAAVNRSGTDRVAEAAERLGLDGNDIVINVQGDQPLLNPRCLDQLVAPIRSGAVSTMTTLAFKIIDKKEIFNPKDVKVTIDNAGDALYFSRAPIPWGRDAGDAFDVYKHLGFYAYPKRFLDVFRNLPSGKLEKIEKLEQLRALAFGYSIRVVVTEYDSPEVDIPEDIERIENIISS